MISHSKKSINVQYFFLYIKYKNEWLFFNKIHFDFMSRFTILNKTFNIFQCLANMEWETTLMMKFNSYTLQSLIVILLCWNISSKFWWIVFDGPIQFNEQCMMYCLLRRKFLFVLNSLFNSQSRFQFLR